MIATNKFTIKEEKSPRIRSTQPMQINNLWYLGIDLGTTGLCAVLLNLRTGELHPIYWATQKLRGSTEYSAQNPVAAYSGIVPKSDLGELPQASVVVGFLASSLARNHSGVFIQKFKPFFKMGIPFYSPRTNNWEPVLQWSREQTVSLYWLGRALQALLVTLKPSLNPALAAPVKVGAAGLDTETFNAALLSLSGVIMGGPGGWGDTYRFNLREAVLSAGLVKHPEQIFFLEDAIATVLGELSTSRSAELGVLSDELKQKSGENFFSSSSTENSVRAGKVVNSSSGTTVSALPAPTTQNSLRGGTLVINAGATTTELALVDLPYNIQELSHSDFMVRSFPYGGSFLDQDIICQLLLRQGGSSHQEGEVSLPLLDRLCCIDSDFELPLPGEPARETRYRLQQQLHSTPLGLALLEAAQKLKMILQHQDEFILDLGQQKCVCTASDLEDRVFQPFVKRLNQELNTLLSQTKLSGQGINQVICSGKTSALSQIQKWLQRKFPNATIIKDEVRSMKFKNDSIHTSTFTLHTSKVAFGLASLPLYPHVLERQEQQYSDYFLLLELCRAFPDKSLSVLEIMQLLENRGINTRGCQQRLIAILEGQLPTNLVPSYPDAIWLTETSQQNLEYQGATAAPLFYKEGERYYRLNLQQCQRVWRYLNIVLSGTYQKLEEPLIVNLG